MAGRGSRAKDLGKFKQAISIRNRPILLWALLSIREHIDDEDVFVIVTTKSYEQEFRVSLIFASLLSQLGLNNKYMFKFVDSTPDGPGSSVYHAKDLIQQNIPLVIVNSDQFCLFEFPNIEDSWDGFMPLHFNMTGKSSYVSISEGQITSVAEKQLISNYASSGIYGYKKASLLFRALEYSLQGPPHHNEEYFIGPVNNSLIRDGALMIPTQTYLKYDLGNSKGIHYFEDKIISLFEMH